MSSPFQDVIDTFAQRDDFRGLDRGSSTRNSGNRQRVRQVEGRPLPPALRRLPPAPQRPAVVEWLVTNISSASLDSGRDETLIVGSSPRRRKRKPKAELVKLHGSKHVDFLDEPRIDQSAATWTRYFERKEIERTSPIQQPLITGGMEDSLLDLIFPLPLPEKRNKLNRSSIASSSSTTQPSTTNNSSLRTAVDDDYSRLLTSYANKRQKPR